MASSLPLLGAAALAAGVAAGNINVSLSGGGERLDLPSSTRDAQAAADAAAVALETTRRARFFPAPTDVAEVKAALRARDLPVTLFGEGPADRRERLKRALAEADVLAAVAAEGVAAVTSAVAGSAAAAMAAASAAANAAAAAGGAAGAPALPPAPPREGVPAAGADGEVQTEVFYTPAATPALAEARTRAAAFSFVAAAARLAAAAAASGDAAVAAREDAVAAATLAGVRRLRPALSVVADDRPLSACALSSDGALLAVASWSGVVKLWCPATGVPLAALKGHRERVVGVAWAPGARLAAGGGAGSGGAAGRELVATASADGTARVWRVPMDVLRDALDDAGAGGEGRWGGESALARLARGGGGDRGARAAAPAGEPSGIAPDDDMGGHATAGAGAGAAATAAAAAAAAARAALPGLLGAGVGDSVELTGHGARLSAVAWHPSGELLGTTSYDRTWRLWDVRAGVPAGAGRGAPGGGLALLAQEGHARETFPLAFHPDGSLLAVGDLSGLGRVWDLRSGKAVYILRGHTSQLLALDWSPNGTTIASGSDDNSCLVWDVRAQRTLYTLPAHGSLVARVRFAPATGEFLLSASFDGTVKAWGARDWAPLATLRGHDGKVTGVDVLEAPAGGGGGGGRGGGGGWWGGAGGPPAVVTVGFDRTFKTWVA